MLTCWCRWWLSHHTPGRSPKRTLGIGPFAENMWLASDFLKANIAVRSTKVVRKSKTKSCVQFMKLDWSLRVQQTNTTTFFCIVHPCLVHVRLVMPTIQRQWPEGERVGFTAVSDGLQKVIVHSSKAQMFWCLRHLSFWSTESDANQPCQFGQTYSPETKDNRAVEQSFWQIRWRMNHFCACYVIMTDQWDDFYSDGVFAYCSNRSYKCK